jgi:hypothetical protein
MTATRLSRSALALSLVLMPVLGLVAAVALPALRSTRAAEVAAIAAHPDRFFLYAIAILLSSYLSVPAFFGVMAVLRERAPLWSVIAGGLTQIGLLVAIGDGATELLYWQMGAPGADPAQMAGLADRYENAPGVSVIYSFGGLAIVVGTILIGVATWRTQVVPRWSAVAVVAGTVANVAGFTMASQTVLAGSYVLLLAAFVPFVVRLVGPAPSVEGERATVTTSDPGAVPAGELGPH